MILIFTTLDCAEAGGRQLLRSLQIEKTDGLFLQLFLIHPSSFWQSIYHPPQNAADIKVRAFAGIHMHEAYVCRSSDGALLKSQGITCYVWPLLTIAVFNECCLMRTYSFPGCIGYLREKTFWTFPTPSHLNPLSVEQKQQEHFFGLHLIKKQTVYQRWKNKGPCGSVHRELVFIAVSETCAYGPISLRCNLPLQPHPLKSLPLYGVPECNKH